MKQCDRTAFSCVCVVAGEHVRHVCDCGGEWTGEGSAFAPWVMPGGADGEHHQTALSMGWEPGTP